MIKCKNQTNANYVTFVLNDKKNACRAFLIQNGCHVFIIQKECHVIRVCLIILFFHHSKRTSRNSFLFDSCFYHSKRMSRNSCLFDSALSFKTNAFYQSQRMPRNSCLFFLPFILSFKTNVT